MVFLPIFLQILLFFLAYYNSTGHVHHILFIDSSSDGHWGWFHFLAIKSRAAIKTDVCAA